MSRQNVYDDQAFFAGYQQLRDAESGINAAVEQPGLRALLPEVTGRTVLDLGCGDGALARDLAARGATRVMYDKVPLPGQRSAWGPRAPGPWAPQSAAGPPGSAPRLE